jgi:hypothetical protein
VVRDAHKIGVFEGKKKEAAVILVGASLIRSSEIFDLCRM